MQQIVDSLDRTGRLSNTLIVFASDNGLTLGQFNLLGMKNFPYASQIPLIMRWDDAPEGSALSEAGETDTRLVALPDLAPTFREVAGLPAMSTDGFSLLDPATQRSTLTLSAWQNRGDSEEGDTARMPSYCAVRTSTWLYVRYQGGFEELYDLAGDPGMLVNRSADISLAKMLTTLRKTNRAGCDPKPPDYSWAKG